MNREFLKGLGLEDEAIDKVMTEHGKTVNSIKDKADSVEGLEAQINDYKDQLKDRDKQLNDLSEQAKGNEDLQKQIQELQQANDDTTKEYQDKLTAQQKDFAIVNALREQKVKDPELLKHKLDLDVVTFKDGKLTGIDDQLKSLKESHDYLFEQETKPNSPQIVATGNPQGGAATKSITEMNYQELADLKANNPAQFAELTKQ